MLNQDLTRIKVQGFGRCIYCGGDGGSDGLRDEHIIALSLGAEGVIEKGSCRKCERATVNLDGYLANDVFGQFRLHRQISSKRKRKKAKPTSLPAAFKLGEQEFEMDLPLEVHPHSLSLPEFEPPRLLASLPPDDKAGVKFLHIYTFLRGKTPDPAARIADTPGIGIRVDASVKPITFLRAIAKNAYCCAVAGHGLDAIDWLDLPRLIVEGDPMLATSYVGSPGGDPPPPAPGVWHATTLSSISVGGKLLVYLDLRLFAFVDGGNGFGLPVYRVVLGEPKGELKTTLEQMRSAQ